MSRSRFPLFLLIGLLLAMATSAVAAPPQDKLNVLFFAVDDLRTELNCYGASQIVSPNIDALAAKGVLFEHAYCQQAVCSPSRTSLLTGLRPDSTQVYDLETHFRDTVPDVVTLPQQFMRHSYQSVGMGKIFHGSLNDELSWSEPHWTGKAQTYQLPENQEIVATRRAEAKAKKLTGKALRRASSGPPFETADVPDNAYRDGETADHAVETLRRLATDDKPFFLAVGFLKPHLPFIAPKRYWDLYDHDSIELADNPFPPKNVTEFSLTNWGEMRNYWGVPEEGPVTDEQARQLIHAYYACVSYTDAQIGRVVNELDRLGLRDRTVIVLWGDHGWKLGEHGAWCKHTNFELDTHVPLIASMPGAKGNGAKSKALVEFVDIYPTLCELAGLPLPKHLEGTSFAPLLTDPARAWKTAAFSQYPRGGGNRPVMGYSMRTDRYRFTRWVHAKDHDQVFAVELYDQLRDEDENENIAENPENADLVRRLAEQSKRGWKGARPKN